MALRKRLLNAGCGPAGAELPREFATYQVVRLDTDPAVRPDVLSSIIAMPMVESESFDAVVCSHCLEHLYYHEVPLALAEFLRVLKPEGVLHLWTPDLQSIGGRLAMGEPEFMVYQSGLGPVTPLDMLYGMRSLVAAGNLGMAHKCGFTQTNLRAAILRAGFKGEVMVKRERMELVATAVREKSNASGQPSPTRLDADSQGRCVDEGPRLRPEREAAEAR